MKNGGVSFVAGCRHLSVLVSHCKESRCMSASKEKLKPTLAGQRIRSRKRGPHHVPSTHSTDEKVKYDPEGFQADVLKGLAECQTDFEKG